MANLLKKYREAVRKQMYRSTIADMKKNPERYLSIRKVCELLNVEPDGIRFPEGTNLDTCFTGICAWDNYLIPGALYAALPLYGKMTPEQAFARGAKAIITEHQVEEYPCVVVPDIMKAYCLLCGHIQQKYSPYTVAITGSVGKTTTKDMVNCVFSQAFNTFCDVENNNMTTLVGHMIQRMPTDCDCYIQEVHEGDPGSAHNISRIIHPNVAVITNIGESHLGNFGSYEGLIKGVTDITAGMNADGVVVINGDDAFSVNASWDRRTVRVSISDYSADYYAENISPDGDGMAFDIVYDDKRIATKIHMKGDHNVTDALLAFAAAVESKISPERAVEGLQMYRPKGMRQNIVRKGKRTLYIDCYNAAVKSMQTAIDTLCGLELDCGAKRIAVLGDMAELGEESGLLHRKVGTYAANAKLDKLICFGPSSVDMADAAKENGSLQVFHTESREELNALVKKHVGKKDAVLFKASHTTDLASTIKAVYPFTYYTVIFKDRLRRHFARTASLK